jgi:hypothetical protein
MVNFKPFLYVKAFPKFRLKLKLGGLLLCLSFLLNYHPAFTFPPVKSNIAYAEITQEQKVNSEATPVIFQLPHPGYITTTFSNYHPGIDLCSGLGMPIKPIAKGTVVEAGFNFFGLGLVVEVEHEAGYRSLYAHMGKIFVTKGQTVDENNFLGEIGMTGHTSGPHTHLEVSKDGKKIDPLLILPEIRRYPKEEDFAVIQSATPSAVVVPTFTPQPQSTSSALPKKVEIAVPDESTSIINQTLPSPSPSEEPKTDLKTQSLNNILSLNTPKPSPAAVPQGGKTGILGFSLFKK